VGFEKKGKKEELNLNGVVTSNVIRFPLIISSKSKWRVVLG